MFVFNMNKHTCITSIMATMIAIHQQVGLQILLCNYYIKISTEQHRTYLIIFLMILTASIE